MPLIVPPFEHELHSYIGSVCNNMECQVLKVGGFTDHIHILCMLSKKVALVTLLQEVKAHSSKWMKTKCELLDGFYWQDGYGAFSVSPTHVDSVIEYIANQHKHHTNTNFQEEYLVLLRKFKIDHDEKYLWD
jgi:REP element-mobilizing transposase RayT